MEKNVVAVLNELQRLSPHYELKISGADAWIKCPNPEHKGGNERTPSLKINLTGNAPPGVFYCFGCGIKGNWNKLAKILKLKAKGADFFATEVAQLPPNLDQELLETAPEKFQEFGMLWAENISWRGISGKLLQKLQGFHYFDRGIQQPILFLPVNIHGKLRGGIRCLLEPRDNLPKYRNTPGNWVKQSLFPYDYIKSLQPTTLVLTEGPRDALNLLQYGVPAVCNLGAKSAWSSTKLKLLLDLELTQIILGFDADDTGQKTCQYLKKELTPWIATRRLQLKTGQDPGDLLEKEVRRLKSILTPES